MLSKLLGKQGPEPFAQKGSSGSLTKFIRRGQTGEIDIAVPRFERFKWPKRVPPLSSAQKAISDDFMKHWHEILPQRYGSIERFNHSYPLRIVPQRAFWRTLEIGAGIGGHLKFEPLERQEYHCVELRPAMAAEIRRLFPQVTTITGDCQGRLPYPDGYFDRVVVIHVLEHLPELPNAIDEIYRLLRPSGLLSIVFPCDPGALYEVARKMSAERIFRARYDLPYRWLIRREHINSPGEITEIVKRRFDVIDRTFFPVRVPIIDLNLCIGLTATKPDEDGPGSHGPRLNQFSKAVSSRQEDRDAG